MFPQLYRQLGGKNHVFYYFDVARYLEILIFMLLFSSCPCKWLSASQAKASTLPWEKKKKNGREKQETVNVSDFFFSLPFKTEFLRIKWGSLRALCHTQGLCHNDGIGKIMWHTAHGPLSRWRPTSASRFFWDLVKIFPIDTFCQCPGPGCSWQHQPRKTEEGFETLEEMEVGKEKPSTRNWEDRQWETPLCYLLSCICALPDVSH